MNYRETERVLRDIQEWYRTQIHTAAGSLGGMDKLSVQLGYNELYLYKVLKRDSFSALRRVVTKIQGLGK